MPEAQPGQEQMMDDSSLTYVIRSVRREYRRLMRYRVWEIWAMSDRTKYGR
jgi:hypothetical protein